MVDDRRDDDEIFMTPVPHTWDVMQRESVGGACAVDLEIARRDSPGSESVVPLTCLEREVLAISATGRCVAEVAASLSRPTGEVRAALGTAIVKLGARSKLEAVLIAMRASLIELPEQTRGVTSQGDDAGTG